VAGALAVSLAGLLATRRASAADQRTAGPGGIRLTGRARRAQDATTSAPASHSARRAAIGPIVLPCVRAATTGLVWVSIPRRRWGESGEVIRIQLPRAGCGKGQGSQRQERTSLHSSTHGQGLNWWFPSLT